LNACIARTTNLYGGGDPGFERIIPGTIRSAMRDEAPVIKGTGQQFRDYLYVEDAVTAYMRLAEILDHSDTGGKTFSFSAGEPVKVITIVELILKLMGKTSLKPRILGRTGGESSARAGLSTGKQNLPGWTASSSLEAGLKKTIDWYWAHPDQVRLEADSK
jgi:CDP-glucose 4,6-dehydratase